MSLHLFLFFFHPNSFNKKWEWHSKLFLSFLRKCEWETSKRRFIFSKSVEFAGLVYTIVFLTVPDGYQMNIWLFAGCSGANILSNRQQVLFNQTLRKVKSKLLSVNPCLTTTQSHCPLKAQTRILFIYNFDILKGTLSTILGTFHSVCFSRISVIS